MERYPHNIESRKAPGKPYRVGYDRDGFAWRIYGETGKYYATSPHVRGDSLARWMLIQSGTLAGISEQLAGRGDAIQGA